jgi:EAL domain-containing protein (putative c-di-GMP-specific phosphodiesterase class I)/GGDEF domain-containing protein
MKHPLSLGASPDRYRAGYLKLKSVLYDRATGLPAFPVLFDELHAMLDSRREIGVLHVEVANLEMVESLYGWQTFDRIVARVAGLLRDAVGQELPADTLLAVNGVAGDRFACFLPQQPTGADVDEPFLGSAGRSICQRLDEAFDDDAFTGLSPRLCFRAGHALLSANPFFRFERCVYNAVEKARTTHDRLERRRDLSWGEELNEIIHGAQVETLFQPVVELESRSVLGFEALSRGPRDTMFEAPRAMFALSDRVGVADELDRVCCESALRAFSTLSQGGKAFVNVLPPSLEDRGWIRDGLLPLLRGIGVEPGEVVFEVSERFAHADPQPFVSQLERFREDGFGLALDDVGTGRAGIEAVKRLRPDYLKLDVSLVRNVDEQMIQQDVVKSIAELAEKIDAAVIGEGVESRAEAEMLSRSGARYAQGYFFAQPAAAGSTQLDRPMGSGS